MNSTRSRDPGARLASVPTETRVLALLTVVLVVVVFASDFGVLTPDTKPEIFLQPAQTAARFASAWLDTPNLGTSNYNTGVVPVAALFSLFELVGVPAWVVMRLWRIALLVCAAWGARLLVRELVTGGVGGRGRRPAWQLGESGRSVAGVAAAVAYAANPYVVIGGGTTPTLLPYALLPWLVLCWLRGFRAPSWRWACAAALVLAGMSGLNAGVVPLLQLVVLVPVVLHALVVEGHRFVPVAWLVLRTGLVYAVLSAYWVVPAVSALGVGTAIAEATESTAAINAVNSFPEVLRGLGMWTLYGASASGPFDPGRLSYVLGPVVVLLTFGVPLLAGIGVRLSRSPARLFGATSVLVGAVVMVGTFPNDDKSAWGRAVGAAIEHVPGLIAFRTTNKAGAVIELGLAVLVALAAAAVVPWLRTARARWVAGWTAAALVAGAVAPAMSGDLFWVRMDVPSYWDEAADVVNARPGDSRVLMVPGTGVPGYSWGYTGPDEIGPSLFRRPFVFRSASPSGGEYAANLLAEVDRRLHQGTLPPGAVSTLAAYIGAGDVVGRYDVKRGGTTTGERVEEQLSADPGLSPAQRFGPPDAARGAPAPATVRSVAGTVPRTSAAVRAASGTLVVDGAGSSLPNLQSAGLLDERPALLLAGSLTDDQLEEALRTQARVVLTDSNARREWSNSDPKVAGPLLRATEEPAATRALFGPGDQTVEVIRGTATVETTGRGLLFGPHAYGDVTQAFDGDRTTGWQFGSFGSGVGNSVVITPRTPMPMPSITLSPMQGGLSRITTAEVTAVTGGQEVTREVTFTPWNTFPVTTEVSSAPVSRLTVTVTGVAGPGAGAVGFSEIGIPGVTLDRAAALPARLARRLPAAAAAAGVDLADVPVDVVLRRSVGDADGLTTEEPRLEREFTLPDERRFEAAGSVRLSGGATDAAIDDLAGLGDEVVAQSSSRAFGSPSARASMALDDSGGDPDLSTAWVPNEPTVGEWISVDFPRRRLSSFTFTQDSMGWATKALVSVDDGEPFEVALDKGTSRITLPESMDASRVRVLLTERAGIGHVRVTDIGLPRKSTTPVAPTGCVRVGTVDGQPIEADLREDFAYLLEGRAVPFDACGDGITLAEGRHRLSGDPTMALDDLRLSSAGPQAAPVAAPTFDVVRHGSASMELRLTSDCSPCLVSSGQAFDARWTAEVDGRDLGAPLVVDGYAAGWRVDAAPGEVVRLSFGPAKAAVSAWAASGAALVTCLALLLLGSRRPVDGRHATPHRRRRRMRP